MNFEEAYNGLMEILDEASKVRIFRALLGGKKTIRKGDYLTKSVKFAVEHAENNHIYEDEAHDVVTVVVNEDDIEDASNPGEYLSKINVEGDVIYTSKGDDYEGWDSVKNEKMVRKYRFGW